MIKKIQITGLHGSKNHTLDLFEDFSLITGRNGAGKTSVLKLAWYLISGNIERTVREVAFERAVVTTDSVEVEVEVDGVDHRAEVRIVATFSGSASKDFEDVSLSFPRADWGRRLPEIDAVNEKVARASGTSFFFPTFRRIEGGFAATRSRGFPHRRSANSYDALIGALEDYAENLSVFDHHFVSSLSIGDVQALLAERFAESARQTAKIHQRLHDDLVKNITLFKSGSSHPARTEDRYRRQLEQLAERLEVADKERAETLEKFDRLEEIVVGAFDHPGIRLTSNIFFGDPKDGVMADHLSAGEKQLFSFFCYNAFSDGAAFFIDEPEISLHPDWQRRLISLLASQGGGNQFILTTHSPFIYARMPQREIRLSEDRGE